MEPLTELRILGPQRWGLGGFHRNPAKEGWWELSPLGAERAQTQTDNSAKSQLISNPGDSVLVCREELAATSHPRFPQPTALGDKRPSEAEWKGGSGGSWGTEPPPRPALWASPGKSAFQVN